MRSSSGVHFIALDHVRAMAAFMVFTWHFIHGANGCPIPFNYVPALFPFSLLDEGHTGVALFMTLSGYLFAKLLDGKAIDYMAFLWNRVLRLFPLLVVVILIVGIMNFIPRGSIYSYAYSNFITGGSIYSYAYSIASGALFPSLPNGGWSITVEFHYYVILPLFLWMLRKSKLLPISLVVAAIALRLLIYHSKGEIQYLTFFTIVGRIDQFAIGMLIFQFREHFAHRHILFIGTFITFTMFYWYFDLCGGFYQNPSYPSPSPLWIFLPTIEGVAYAIGVAWYDNSFSPSNSGTSRFIGRIGEFSYSIYLLHFFVVFDAVRFVNIHVMNLSNFYIACFWSVICFLLMVPIGYLSFRFIEAPFLKLRKTYTTFPNNLS